tara:strand:- start:147 stop:686 length:540 start_codon:yes stop_codon:yes gene_type:complete
MQKLLIQIIVFIVFLTAFLWIYNDAERNESGQIVAEGDLDALSLEVGDCFNNVVTDNMQEDDGKVTFTSVQAVPCISPHLNQVFAKSSSLFEDQSSFPSENIINTRSWDFCLEKLPSFLSLDYDSEDANQQIEDFNSKVEVSYYTPTEIGWNEGDSTVDCIIYSKGGNLTRSYEGIYQK